MVSGAYIVRRTHSAPPGDPLEWILGDHLLLRQVCADLDTLADLPAAHLAEAAALPYGFLRDEYLVHHLDEEESLFPLLRRRCRPEDEIETTLARLTGDHGQGMRVFGGVMRVLEGLVQGESVITPDDARLLADFAAAERRHLIVENAIMLPIARARLTRADLSDIRAGMLRRRGLDRIGAR